MSALEKMKVAPEVRKAIQDSLPQGQSIRHLVLVYDVTMDWQNQIQVNNEFFLTVTDAVIATRGLAWDWDLTPQQLKVKQDLESKKHKDILAAGVKFARKIGLQIPTEEDRVYSDAHIWKILQTQYGPVKMKWLPRILWSKDFMFNDFNFHSYAELNPLNQIAAHFSNRGHQTTQIAEVGYTLNGSEWHMASFFCDLREIYDHVRERKLQGSSQYSMSPQITKCQSCGSTELTVQDSHLVCDYCQSKYAR